MEQLILITILAILELLGVINFGWYFILFIIIANAVVAFYKTCREFKEGRKDGTE